MGIAFRTAAIRSFEYCYQLAISLMLRELEEQRGAEGVPEFAFQGLFRIAAQHGLVESAEAWESYREQRNRTLQTHREVVASGGVFAGLPGFIGAARGLLERARARHAGV
jgi:hypothetical protein